MGHVHAEVIKAWADPVTGMTAREIDAVWYAAPSYMNERTRYIANAALRHAIDSGQVSYPACTMTYYGDMAEAVKRNTARDMAIAEAVFSACQHSRFSIPGFDDIDLAAIIATVKD